MQCTTGTRSCGPRPLAASRRPGSVAARASVTAAEHVRCVNPQEVFGSGLNRVVYCACFAADNGEVGCLLWPDSRPQTLWTQRLWAQSRPWRALFTPYVQVHQRGGGGARQAQGGDPAQGAVATPTRRRPRGSGPPCRMHGMRTLCLVGRFCSRARCASPGGGSPAAAPAFRCWRRRASRPSRPPTAAACTRWSSRWRSSTAAAAAAAAS